MLLDCQDVLILSAPILLKQQLRYYCRRQISPSPSYSSWCEQALNIFFPPKCFPFYCLHLGICLFLLLFLIKMEHPNISVLQREDYIWNLASVPLLNQYIHVMDGYPVQKVVKAVLEQYQIQVVPKLPLFRKCKMLFSFRCQHFYVSVFFFKHFYCIAGINHGDFNDHNLLVKPDGPSQYKISGILDFGDMSCGYFIFELAITIMYMMIENPNPVDIGGPVVAGWESVFPLNEAERDSLYLLVLCRFCQSLVMARHAVIQQPENEEYLMITARTGVRHLCHLWELGKEEVERIWFQSAAQFGQP